MVAVSKEVNQLMMAFPGSLAFGISTHYGVVCQPRARRYGVHPRLHPLVRPILALLERRRDINHVYTSLGDWHFLSILGRRPIVLTLTQRSTPADVRLLTKVDHVVAESDSLAEDARQAGIAPERISIVYPGIDLNDFVAAAPPPINGIWRGVLASSPETVSEIESKGLNLLLDLARLEPSFHLTVLWRPFGASSDKALAAVRRHLPANVHIRVGRVARIQDCYSDAHFSVAPFRTVGKPCPNSVLEGLATGRPALVSDYTDLGQLLETQQAGVCFSPTVEDLRRAFRVMCANYSVLQQRSRQCAERYFNLEEVIRHYARVYAAVTSSSERPARHA